MLKLAVFEDHGGGMRRHCFMKSSLGEDLGFSYNRLPVIDDEFGWHTRVEMVQLGFVGTIRIDDDAEGFTIFDICRVPEPEDDFTIEVESELWQ